MDVAVVGAGPAGTACTISLRRTFPELSVTLFEATGYRRERPGEVLSGAGVRLLRRLGVPCAALQRLGVMSESVVSSWGQSSLIENHSLFARYGPGLHLDRNSFDRCLAELAQSLGTVVYCDAPFRSIERINGEWSLAFGGNGRWRARFVVDATGRAAVLARSLGARVRRLDRLTAYSLLFDQCSHGDHETVIEPCALGWWYTASLPNRRRVASLLTDADLGLSAGLHRPDAWHTNLEATEHVGARVANATPASASVSPACSAWLDPVGGEGWVAAGDAALSFDPLAGQGITSAIRSGILASYAARDSLLGVSSAAQSRYQAVLRAQFAALRKMHQLHYNREGRWRDEPFWQRRQGANQFVPQAPTP